MIDARIESRVAETINRADGYMEGKQGRRAGETLWKDGYVYIWVRRNSGHARAKLFGGVGVGSLTSCREGRGMLRC